MDTFFTVYSTVMFVAAFVFYGFSKRHLTIAHGHLESAAKALVEAQDVLNAAKRHDADAKRLAREAQSILDNAVRHPFMKMSGVGTDDRSA